jgi:hypothetical protein
MYLLFKFYIFYIIAGKSSNNAYLKISALKFPRFFVRINVNILHHSQNGKFRKFLQMCVFFEN